MKMNIKTGLLITLLTVCFCCISCSKSESVKIENDETVCEQISGNWSNKVRLESVVFTDSESADSNVANITSISTTNLTLGKDNTFSLEIDRKLENFTPIVDDCPYTREQIAETVDQYFKIEGTYAADSEILQLTNKIITLADGTSISAEEYQKQDSSLGPIVQNFPWSMENDILYFKNASSDEEIEYRRIK